MSESTTAQPPPSLAQLEAKAVDLATSATATIMNAAPGSEPSWAKPAVAILSLILFAGMIVVAYVTQDDHMKTLLGGSVIGMASTAISYYLGSSSGSERKTALLAAAPAIPAHPTA